MPWFFNASRVSATRVIAREGKPRTGRRSLETIDRGNRGRRFPPIDPNVVRFSTPRENVAVPSPALCSNATRSSYSSREIARGTTLLRVVVTNPHRRYPSTDGVFHCVLYRSLRTSCFVCSCCETDVTANGLLLLHDRSGLPPCRNIRSGMS